MKSIGLPHFSGKHLPAAVNFKPIKKDDLLFSSSQLRALLIPLMIEQLLNAFMGMADTMMVARVGSVAISAVSLTDSINTLVIQVFSALAAGGTIICSQYLGQNNSKRCNAAARQVILTVLALSTLSSILCLIFRYPLLHLIFGSVSKEVMDASLVYFFITAMSYPFFAMFQVGGALYRACGNSRFPMMIAVSTNLMNIAGNAILIFVFHYGVAGAAISTLASRIISMIWIFIYLRKDRQKIIVRHYLQMRPDAGMIKRVLFIGLPAGMENGMFQFGKLAIQSSVSTLGTSAIAAQALDVIFENLNGIAGIGIGIGLMTVVAQCIGAGKKDQARYYIIRLAVYAEIAVSFSTLLILLLGKPAIALTGMDPDTAKLCFHMLIFISIFKPLLWVPSFIPAYGFRAAGDVQYSMLVSSLSMWLCRVALTVLLIRVFHMGPIAVWIGMSSDWFVRGIIFTSHFFSGKWLKYKVV